MKRSLQIGGSCLAFLAVCAGVLGFLWLFTQTDSPFTYPIWEEAAVVSPAGEETPFDPAGPLPALEEGTCYRFRTLLPEERENGVFLLLETTGLEAGNLSGRAGAVVFRLQSPRRYGEPEPGAAASARRRR